MVILRDVVKVWKQDTALYSNGKLLYLGKYAVGSVFWDGCTSNKELRYGVKCLLPGIKTHLSNKATEEEAMEFLEKIVELWVKNARIVEEG